MVMLVNLMISWDNVWKKVGKPSIIGSHSQKQVFKILDRMLKDFPNETAILDVGCGIGITLAYLRRKFPNAIGIDNSKEALIRCEQRGFRIAKDVYDMDATEIMFANRFDIVFSWGLLEHFSNFNPFINEMCKASKKHVLLVQPNINVLYGKIITKLTNVLKRGIREYAYTTEDFVKAFEERAFHLLQRKSTLLNEFQVLMFARREKF